MGPVVRDVVQHRLIAGSCRPLRVLFIGRWLKINGEGIYATRTREGELWHEGENVRFTRSKDNKIIYAHCLQWLGEKLVLKTVEPKKDSEIIFLGSKKSLKWTYSKINGLEISVPADIKNQLNDDEQLAFTFQIQSA